MVASPRQPHDALPEGWREVPQDPKFTWHKPWSEPDGMRTIRAGELEWTERRKDFEKRHEDPGGCWTSVRWSPRASDGVLELGQLACELDPLGYGSRWRGEHWQGEAEKLGALLKLEGLSRTEQLAAGWLEAPSFEVPFEFLEPEVIPQLLPTIMELSLQHAVPFLQEEHERELADQEFWERSEEIGFDEAMAERNRHPTQRLTTPEGRKVDIDVGMVGAIQALWQAGVKTNFCCQGDAAGGLYIQGNGEMPSELLHAVRGAGFKHRIESYRWTFWDSAPPQRQVEFHRKAQLMMSDLAAGGLAGLDQSGDRYRPERSPAPSLKEWRALTLQRFNTDQAAS